MANTTSWVLETVVAKKMGVTRGVIAAHRKNGLEKNRDWRIERKQVELSQFAIEKISTALGTTPPPAETNSAASPAPVTASVPELVELQVAKIYPNPRLLLARTADGQLVQVSVPKNKNFRPLMRFKAHPPDPPPAGQLFRLEGRCPRYPGRW